MKDRQLFAALASLASRSLRRPRAEPKPLFAPSDPIHIIIQAPLSTLTRNRDDAAVAGTLTDPTASPFPISLAFAASPAERRTSATSRRCASTSPRRRRRLRCSPARSG